MIPKRKNNSLFRFLINHIHLWAGLLSSVILFVVCLTGTIYTFRAEVEQWLEPHKYKVENIEGEKRGELEKKVNFAEASTGFNASRITIFDEPTKPLEIQLHREPEDRRGLTHYVHPYQDEVLGTAQGPASGFFFWIFRMHRWLLMDSSIGRPIVGIATLIFVGLSITGFFLWVPKKWKKWRNYKQGFKVKWNASFKRLNLDLHKVLGFYVLPFIIIMSLTGLCWSFDWYRTAANNVLGAPVFSGKIPTKLTSEVKEDKSSISFENVLSIAQKELNYRGKTTIFFPKGEEGIYEIRKVNTHTFHKDGVDKVILDQYTGEILSKELFKDKTFGAKIAGQIHSLHMGTSFGLFSKILYFITCLIATSLPVTGIIVWLNKYKKKKVV